MKTILTSIQVLCMAVVFMALGSASICGQEMTYKGYVLGSETIQKKAVEQMQQRVKDNPNSIEARYQLLEAQYVLLNGTMTAKKEDVFDEYIDEAEENAEAILEMDKNHPQTKGILSTLYGLKIAYSPIKGMFLGSSSANLAKEAITAGENEPIAWLKYGANKYNTPEMWGGDKAEALKSFKKAVTLFEESPEQLSQNFHYLDALAWLGIAYKRSGDTEKAKEIFEKALKVEPDFAWVKSSLLPSVN